MTMRAQDCWFGLKVSTHLQWIHLSQDPCKIALFWCLPFFVPLIQSQALFCSGTSRPDCVGSLWQYLGELEFTYWLQEDHLCWQNVHKLFHSSQATSDFWGWGKLDTVVSESPDRQKRLPWDFNSSVKV